MEFLLDYGAFLLKAITVVVAVLLIAGGIVSLSSRAKRSHHDGELVIKKLNDELEDHKEHLEDMLLDEATLKAMAKARKKEDKEKAKADKLKAKEERRKLKAGEGAIASVDDDRPSDDADTVSDDHKKRVFVLDFDGDIQASDVELLRQEITAILTMATAQDEIILRLESGGGMVHSYGLAASQLQRIRDKGIPLTVCVDRVAASGGYMMACLADKLVSAPFAIIGSIGVVAQLPNFNRLLKKHDVDFELFTAGEHKRTVTMFGQNTSKAKEKFQADLEDTHELFKQHVSRCRPSVDVNAVATGDIWYGQQALDHDLIDVVGTSDDIIVQACDEADVYHVRYEYKRSLQERFGIAAQTALATAFTRVLTALQKQVQSKG